LSGQILTLIPCAHPEVSMKVRQTLSSLGYQPELFTPEQLGAGDPPPSGGAVIFLLGQGKEPRDRVLSVMERVRARPMLGMLVQGEAGWDRELTAHFCDCAQWPCAKEELAFRLDRLSPEAASVPSAPDPGLYVALEELNLVGCSKAFLEVMGRLRRMVPCDAPVLIEGETGTGKELVARAIHYLGPRSGAPFVPINCGALPDPLLENELFGHERGAYTDARSSTPGAIGEAAGGTLFLDEVEALSAKAQVALLRFLQSREYRPLGSRRPRQSDTRIIAASNADLRHLCERREFRTDLYFRLDILSLTLPPLRDRVDDIEILARYFIDCYRRRYGLQPMVLDPRSLSIMQAYRWPGNVRELENLIHRTVLLADGNRLSPSPGCPWPTGAVAQPQAVAGFPRFADAKARAIERFERDYLTRLLDETGGNVTEAARRAHKERRALGKLLKKHAIARPSG
jgi:DNA-binding NtrC family response regulator